MSYTKDRDRYSRGVGAIAARDLAPGAKRRFAKRTKPNRSMGDAPSGDCSIYANGTYYVRRASGQVEKVSPSEAAKYPSCSDGSSRVAGITIASPSKTGPSGGVGFASKFSAVPVLTRPTYGSGSRPVSSGPASSSVTPAAPYVTLPPSSPSPPPPWPQPSSTPPPPPQPLPPKPLPPKPPRPPRSIIVQTSAIPTTSTPAATTSVVTTWLPPIDTPVTPDTSTPITTPTQPSSSGRNLLLVGAGIGLLYLLTRK